MVGVLNRVIEKVAIRFDPLEDKALTDQLKGYQEKRSISGRPTYSASSATVGDHDLDALMLAMFAFNVEYDDIFANMKSQLAINILSAKEVHGVSIEHLNPNKQKVYDWLEIRTKKRENHTPGSRTSYKGAEKSMYEEKGVGSEIRSDMGLGIPPRHYTRSYRNNGTRRA